MEQDNLRIPPLVLPAAQQTAAAGSPDEGTEMHTASPATPASPASSSLQPSPLLAPSRAYPSLNNNLYIPHHASIPDPLLFSPSSPSLQHPEDRSYDAEKRSRRHHKHQKSRHERDERHLRNPSFPIEQVAEMPFHLGKKKARAAAAEAEERAKAQEKRELDEKARRDREAKENKEELARRFLFTRTREAVTQASVDELHTRRLEAEAYVFSVFILHIDCWYKELYHTNIPCAARIETFSTKLLKSQAHSPNESKTLAAIWLPMPVQSAALYTVCNGSVTPLWRSTENSYTARRA